MQTLTQEHIQSQRVSRQVRIVRIEGPDIKMDYGPVPTVSPDGREEEFLPVHLRRPKWRTYTFFGKDAQGVIDAFLDKYLDQEVVSNRDWCQPLCLLINEGESRPVLAAMTLRASLLEYATSAVIARYQCRLRVEGPLYMSEMQGALPDAVEFLTFHFSPYAPKGKVLATFEHGCLTHLMADYG